MPKITQIILDLRLKIPPACRTVIKSQATMRSSVIIIYGSGLLLIFGVMWVAATGSDTEVDPAWENIFRHRSDDDWRAVWHTEKHRRCYHNLLAHMDWVCEKDIYAVGRRKKRNSQIPWIAHYRPLSSSLSSSSLAFLQKRNGHEDEDEDDHLSRDVGTELDGEILDPFLDTDQATSIIGNFNSARRRRGDNQNRHKRGIIDECCHAAAGCSWEEYAEYCPANSRMRAS